jgi:CheY-like chemotaxis protein
VAMCVWLVLLDGDKSPTSGTVSWLTGVAAVLWPLITLFVVWRFWPALKLVIESRSFTVDIFGVKLTAEEATKKLQSQIDDLEKEFLKLKAGLELPSAKPSVPAPAPVQPAPASGRILWVDDFPTNNVFEAAKLRRDGFLIDQVLSTEEALDALSSRPYQMVISDMGRKESGSDKPDAGLLLLSKMRERGFAVPVAFFASEKAVARYGLRAEKSGAKIITSSALELFEVIQQICGKPLQR